MKVCGVILHTWVRLFRKVGINNGGCRMDSSFNISFRLEHYETTDDNHVEVDGIVAPPPAVSGGSVMVQPSVTKKRKNANVMNKILEVFMQIRKGTLWSRPSKRRRNSFAN